jgi:TetR/AcrR family transcriptional regulator
MARPTPARSTRDSPTARSARANGASNSATNRTKKASSKPAVVDIASASQRRRRSPDPGRQRDPVRTRQLILDAASQEFGRFGYDGARVVRIAERAGVAHQLITYHFGGKKGLFEALSDQWVSTSRSLVEGDAPTSDALQSIVHQASEEAAWARALIREGQQDQDHGELVERLAPLLANARARQQRGDIATDLDAGIVVLVFFAATLAPTSIPHITRAFSQVDPSDPKFVDYYAEQLGLIIKQLGASPTPVV